MDGTRNILPNQPTPSGRLPVLFLVRVIVFHLVINQKIAGVHPLTACCFTQVNCRQVRSARVSLTQLHRFAVIRPTDYKAAVGTHPAAPASFPGKLLWLEKADAVVI